ncbi:DEAD/DEAH box helicase [Ornithinibacillus xuwenensis]|uniref:Helicase-related protein n=1 Tax=Ornithinibacillus xuwenensis TaxID=3144668 RepID=A0ABU9XKB1_9BACI
MACESLYIWQGSTAKFPVWDSPLTWDGTLSRAQGNASNRIVRAIRAKEKELLVWAVCGAGKTEMLFTGIEAALQLGLRICIATPRADVVRELKPRVQQAFQSVAIQALYGGSEEKEGTAQIIISTTHQLLRYYKTFDVMIIDEVDAFPYHNDSALPFAVRRAGKDGHTTIYLTATPRNNLRYRIAINKLPHIFVPTRFHGYPLPVPTLQILYSLKKKLKQQVIPTPLISWINERKNPSRQVLIFVPTISLASELVKSLYDRLKSDPMYVKNTCIESVHSEDEKRIEKITRFRNNEIKILITTSILERGVTFPSVDVMVLHANHSVFDEAALVQIAGRAGRSADDPDGEVVFFHDGKSMAMVKAVRSIKRMNRRGGFKS